MKLWTLIVGTALLVGDCAADVIYLKSGISIHADSVTESSDTITYTVGSTKYSLPKSSVARIDRASASLGVTVTAPARGTLMSAPKTYTPPQPAADSKITNKPSHPKLAASLPQESSSDSVLSRILNLGEIDEQELTSIERAGDRTRTASAYLAACRYELDRGHIAPARHFADRAAEFAPDTASLHMYYAVLFTAQQSYADALSHAKRAAALAPESLTALSLLATVYYNADDSRSAVATWKQLLARRDDDRLREYVARIEHQIEVEAGYAEQASSHFVLRYEGREIGSGLKSDLLRNLEQCYNELTRELSYKPSADIVVVVYSEKTFFDVTHAPAWAGGLYDGKLRIPIGGVKDVTPYVRSVLKHELTHSFIHAMTHGNCPAWLNEGLAQMLEPRSSSDFRSDLAPLFRAGKHAPLQALELNFSRFDDKQATLAYAESLMVTEYLEAQYGRRALVQMLNVLGNGEGAEEALRTVTRHSYAETEQRLAEFATTPTERGF